MEAVEKNKQITWKKEDFKNLRVAIVHYWFVTWRGGEKVVESILKLFPQADVYTLFFDPNTCGKPLAKHQVHTSILNNPIFQKHYQKVFPLYPIGIKSLSLKKEYDLVISSESGPAKGVSIQGNAPHLCYIHTPMRYCHGFREPYLKNLSSWSRPITSFFFEMLRLWDLTTVNNVTHYVANSQNVADRVQKYYNRNASVCYPPIELELFKEKPQLDEKEFFLSFGAITPYKNIDLLIDVFNKNQKKLVIIGDGSERNRLEKKAKNNIQFLGSLPWSKIQGLIRRSRALIFPGEEDFGMIPLEVMAHGVPVIAYGKGGALETVIENFTNPTKSTGIFFHALEANSLHQALAKFEIIEPEFNPEWIQDHARKFGEDCFQEGITQEILTLLEKTY
ncbi:MAG: glycosyltransferase involved in cell wall biosynthesis [bacterium]